MFGFKYGFGFGYGSLTPYRPYIQYSWSTSVVNDYVTGPELVTNGTFDTDSDWGVGPGRNIADGELHFEVGAYSGCWQSIPLEVGEVYLVSYTVSSYTLGKVGVYFSGGANVLGNYTESEGTVLSIMTAISGNDTIRISSEATAFIGSVDNISVKKVIQKPDVTYLRNTGTGGSTYNAEMFTGRALSFDSASSQSIPIDLITLSGDFTVSFSGNFALTNGQYILRHSASANGFRVNSTNMLVYISGKAYIFSSFSDYANHHTYTFKRSGSTLTQIVDNVEIESLTVDINNLLLDTIGSAGTFGYLSGNLSNLIITNEALTPQQIADYHATPHTFLYKTESGLASDSGLDTSKVVSWFPLTEDDGYVRDVANTDTTSYVDNGVDYVNWDANSDTGVVTDSNGITISADGVSYIDARLPVVLEPSTAYFYTIKITSNTLNTTSAAQLMRNAGIFEESGIDIDGGVTGIYSGIVTTLSSITSSFMHHFVRPTATEGSVTFEVLEFTKANGIYPITNYTTDMPQKGLNYGLQTAKLLLDDNGVVTGKSDFAEFYGDGYVDTGWMVKDEDVSIENIVYINYSDTLKVSGGYQQNRLYIGLGSSGVKAFIRYGDMSVSSEVNEGYHLLSLVASKTDNYIKAFVDGTEIYSTVYSFITSSSYNVTIGAINNGAIYHMDTPIRLFKVHNKVLTQEEITNNFNDYVAQGLLS